MALSKNRLFIMETWKDGSTFSLFRVRASHRLIASATLIFDKCHVGCHRPRVSTLRRRHYRFRKRRFEIASCVPAFTRQNVQSIFVQNGEVFTRDSDINLYRFFSITRYRSCRYTSLTLVWLPILRFSSLSFLY